MIVKWRHCYVTSYHVASQRIQELLGAFLNALFNGEQDKIIHYSCEDGSTIRVPNDHRLSSLGKPRDAKRLSDPQGGFSYPTLTHMI